MAYFGSCLLVNAQVKVYPRKVGRRETRHLHINTSKKYHDFQGSIDNQAVFLIIFLNQKIYYGYLTLYLIETPFNAFANRADPDQAALIRAA